MTRVLKILLPVLLAALLVLGGWLWLRAYTLHGVSMRVPVLHGLTLEEASAMLHDRRLQALVIDSVHVPDVPRGAVVEQDPAAGAEVKPGRKVYLVMNAREPKMLDMPRLVDLSKRQALSVLEILGLRVKSIEYRPDPCLDCVVAQLYQGEPIAPEARIRHGEAITLVLGSGAQGGHVPVPDLIGLAHAEVMTVLNMASLNIGIVVSCDGCNTAADSTLARVYRQAPAPGGGRSALGSPVDIWLTTDTARFGPDERSFSDRTGHEEPSEDAHEDMP
ncbi:MAG: PASTA domain-containing protein [Flavobacteriales bacterium]|jgi:beta-lactam-binding protein with PASTA domain|nr:PASTA domain-containing protein [Flavobacteriales bacterium]